MSDRFGIEELLLSYLLPPDLVITLVDDIVAVVNANVEAEREACAQLTEELTKARAAEMGFLHEIQYRHLTGWQAAAAIRAREESA